MGTQVAGVAQNFTSGAVQTSSRALDVAITNGDGFFRLASPGGEIAYSRNGQFDMDKNGFIVNSAGLRLTGYPVSAKGTISGGSPVPLQMPTAAMAPNSTLNIAAQFNLDSRSIAPAAAFDPENSETYNYANSVTVYDSLGNSHEMSTFFVKSAVDAAAVPPVLENTWKVYATADGNVLTSGGAIAVPPATPGGALGTLAFDGGGKLTTTPATLTVAGLDFANGANPMGFAVDMTGTTQFGNANEVQKLTQDGFTSGMLTSFSIEANGTITGKYSNEQTTPLGQLVLSSFVNPNGLQSKGDNVWAELSRIGLSP